MDQPFGGLRGQLADLRHALDQSAIVAATDVKGTITFVNDKFCEISMYSREELLGQNHRLINSGYHPAEFFREMYRTIASGGVWRADIRNRAKDGSLYWVDTTIVPFLDDRGRPYQYVSIRYDITERKLSEQMLREQSGLVQIGKLAAVVAHEVRNPLAGIRGAMQVMARRMPAASSDARVIDEVIARVDTLNAIVQDLLLFAQPRPLKLAPVRVSALVEELVSLLRDDPRFAGIGIETGARDRFLVVDAGQLKLAIMNFLLNAAQAMPAGGVVRIDSRDVAGWHEIRVVDQGPGIPEDVREHLFEPFFTTRIRGTGLGMPTARGIVERHGGDIRVECPASGGTAVTIRLPVEPKTTSG